MGVVEAVVVTMTTGTIERVLDRWDLAPRVTHLRWMMLEIVNCVRVLPSRRKKSCGDSTLWCRSCRRGGRGQSHEVYGSACTPAFTVVTLAYTP